MLHLVCLFDGYGAGFEYAQPEFVRKYNHPAQGYVQHPKHLTIAPGSYTDDGQMSMAIGELLLKYPVEKWTTGLLAQKFVEAFKRDPREGYAGGFHAILTAVNNGDELINTLTPHSIKSGGAMRAGLIGLLPDTDQVIDTAMFQASLTHATRIGMEAAAAAALMVHYAYYRLGDRKKLGQFLEDLVPGYKWQEPHRQAVKDAGWEHVRAAVTALTTKTTQTAVLKACVGITGDVDTVAAIAGCAVDLFDDIEPDLPKVLLDGLEDGKYGSKYAKGIDARLVKRFPRKPFQIAGGDPLVGLFT